MLVEKNSLCHVLTVNTADAAASPSYSIGFSVRRCACEPLGAPGRILQCGARRHVQLKDRAPARPLPARRRPGLHQRCMRWASCRLSRDGLCNKGLVEWGGAALRRTTQKVHGRQGLDSAGHVIPFMAGCMRLHHSRGLCLARWYTWRAARTKAFSMLAVVSRTFLRNMACVPDALHVRGGASCSPGACALRR